MKGLNELLITTPRLSMKTSSRQNKNIYKKQDIQKVKIIKKQKIKRENRKFKNNKKGQY